MTTASSLQLLSFYWLNQRSCNCTHFLYMCLPAHTWRVVYEVIAPGSHPPCPPIISFVVVSQFSSSFWHSIQETGSSPFGCRLLALIQRWEPQVLPYWPDPVRCRPQVSVRVHSRMCSYTLKSWCALFTGVFLRGSWGQTGGQEHKFPLLSLQTLEPGRLETDGWTCWH